MHCKTLDRDLKSLYLQIPRPNTPQPAVRFYFTTYSKFQTNSKLIKEQCIYVAFFFLPNTQKLGTEKSFCSFSSEQNVSSGKNWAILVKLGPTKKVYYRRMFCHNQFSVNNGKVIYIKEPINQELFAKVPPRTEIGC